jgi:ribokinase
MDMNIKDIAKLAGVSVSTVSKIVNKKDASISQETRERVLKIVKEYNYSPYSSKVSTPKRSWILGILLNSTVALDSTLDGILKEAQKNGYSTLVLNNYDDIQQELKNITTMCKSNVDGIIWEPVSKESHSYSYLLEELNIPIQTIGINGGDDSLLLPYEKTSHKMTQTLFEKGHTSIACLASDSRRMQTFVEGYKKALFNAHLKLREELVFHEINNELLHLIRNQDISGIVVSHYLQAMELYALINHSMIRIPDNFSMISIQNDADFSTLSDSHIKISSVIIKNADFGTFICKKIISTIEQKTFESNFLNDELEIDHLATVNRPYDLHSPKVTVVGSIHMDTYLNTPEIPAEGKTLILSNVSTIPGGKGLNQAVGVAKLGQRVKLIGKIGADLDSDRVYKELEAHGISTSSLIRSNSRNTGQAYIFVQPNGESMISILPGANSELSPADLEEQKERFRDTAYCLLQTEIPLNTIEKACDLAHHYGAKTILKPATNQSIPMRILQKIDILVPNEDALKHIAHDGHSLEERAASLIKEGVETVIVTCGSKGSYLQTATSSNYFEAADFTTIDSTGAGDAFISALTSYLMYGHTVEQAIEIATYAAGFSISREGVIPSLIDKQTLNSYIARLDPVNVKTE